MKPLSFISFALVFSTIYSLINFMENLAVITALYHSGSFRDHLLGFRKNKNVIHQLRSVRIGWNCAQGLDLIDSTMERNLTKNNSGHGIPWGFHFKVHPSPVSCIWLSTGAQPWSNVSLKILMWHRRQKRNQSSTLPHLTYALFQYYCRDSPESSNP